MEKRNNLFFSLKDLFSKSVILIFIFLTCLVCFNDLTIKPVYATDFDDWSFAIDSNPTSDGKYQTSLNIDDGAGGYLGEDAENKGTVWNIILSRYKIFIAGFGGLATLTLVLCGVILFTKLSSTASNPQERSQTIKWVGCFLLAAGLLGSVTLIFSYSYGVFR